MNGLYGVLIMKNLLFIILVSSLSVASYASGDDNIYLEMYLGAGLYSLDIDRDLEKPISVEGGLEVPVNQYFSLETWLSDYTAENKDTSEELDFQRFYGGALLHLKTRGMKRPFITLGYSHLGYERDSGRKSSESLFSFGVGLKRYYSNNVTLRGELMMMNSIDKELIDMGGRLSIGYAFKPTTTKPVQIANSESEQETKAEEKAEAKAEAEAEKQQDPK